MLYAVDAHKIIKKFKVMTNINLGESLLDNKEIIQACLEGFLIFVVTIHNLLQICFPYINEAMSCNIHFCL